MFSILLAIHYWAWPTVRPRGAIETLKAHPSKVAIAFWINLIFAAMYTVTVVIYTLMGRLPAFAPWIPIAAERYYRLHRKDSRSSRRRSCSSEPHFS